MTWSMERQRVYLVGWRARRRAQGLCQTCSERSDRFSRCLACRQRANALKVLRRFCRRSGLLA